MSDTFKRNMDAIDYTSKDDPRYIPLKDRREHLLSAPDSRDFPVDKEMTESLKKKEINFKWRECPALESDLTPAAVKAMDRDDVYDYAKLREEKIGAAILDPLSHGFDVSKKYGEEMGSKWFKAQREFDKYFQDGKTDKIACMGGNRAGKTYFILKRITKFAIENENKKICICSQLKDTSHRVQQEMVFQFLPPKYKECGGESGDKVYWDNKGDGRIVMFKKRDGGSGGFVNNKISFKNGSEIHFHMYSQDHAVIEGTSWDIIFMDEEIPPALYSTVDFRLDKKYAQMITAFTAVSGWTPVLHQIMDGAKLVKEGFSDILQMKAPRLMLSKDGYPIIFYWSEDNPFTPRKEYQRKIDRCSTKQKKLIRAVGYVEEVSGANFPNFSMKTHVTKKKICGECFVSVFVPPRMNMSWYYITARSKDGKVYIESEYPNIEWCEMDDEGKYIKGDGADAQGDNSVSKWAKRLKKLNARDIYIDEVDQKDTNYSILDQLDRNNLAVSTVKKVHIDSRLGVINDFIDSGRLIINIECRNLIFAIRNFSDDFYNRSILEALSNMLFMIGDSPEIKPGGIVW